MIGLEATGRVKLLGHPRFFFTFTRPHNNLRIVRSISWLLLHYTNQNDNISHSFKVPLQLKNIGCIKTDLNIQNDANYHRTLINRPRVPYTTIVSVEVNISIY